MADREIDKLRHRAADALALGDKCLAQARYVQSLVHYRSCAACATEAQARTGWNSDDRHTQLLYATAKEREAYALNRLWKLRDALEVSVVAIGAFVILDRSEGAEDIRLDLARAFNTRGGILTRLERLAQAQHSHERAYAMLQGWADSRAKTSGQSNTGDDLSWHREVARALVGRGNSLADRGDVQAACADYERAIDSLVPGNEEYPILMARAATNLGNILLPLGQLARAIGLFEQAASLLAEQSSGHPSLLEPMLARTLTCHAQACFLGGRLDAAIYLGRKAATILEHHSAGHPADAGSTEAAREAANVGEGSVHHAVSLAEAYSVIGQSLTRAGKLEEAELILERARRMLDHRDLVDDQIESQARCQVLLANALADQRAHADAQRWYRAALRIYTQLLKQGQTQHLPGLARVHTNLGNSLVDAGDAAAGRDHLAEGVLNYERLIQETPIPTVRLISDTIHARTCLANAERAVFHLSKACDLCRQAIAEGEAILAVDESPTVRRNVAAAEKRLTQLLIDSGELESAIACGERACKRYEALIKAEGQVHARAEKAETAVLLANALNERREFMPAVRYYRSAHADYDALVEIESFRQFLPQLARVETNLGNAWRRAGDLLQALPLHDSAVARLQSVAQLQPQLRLQLAHAIRCRADTLADSGRTADASSAYDECIDLLVSLPDKDPAHLHHMAAALARRARFRTKHGQHVEALSDFARAANTCQPLVQRSTVYRTELAHIQINLALVNVATGHQGTLATLMSLANECESAADSFNAQMVWPALRAQFECVRLLWRDGVQCRAGARPLPRDETVDKLLDRIEDLNQRHSDRHHGQLRVLEDGIRLLRLVRPPDWKAEELQSRWPAYDRLLCMALAWMASLLRDADPQWLIEPATLARLAAAVAGLQGLCAHRDALMAEWFIHCFGLRSADRDAKRVFDTPRQSLWEQDPGDVEDSAKRRSLPKGDRSFPPLLSLRDIEARLEATKMRGEGAEALALVFRGPGWPLSEARLIDGEPVVEATLCVVVICAPANARHYVVSDFCPLPAMASPREDTNAWFDAARRTVGAVRQLLRDLRDLDDVQRICLVPEPELCSVPWHLLLASLSMPASSAPRSAHGGLQSFSIFPTVAAWCSARDRAWRSGLPLPPTATRGTVAVVSCDASCSDLAEWLAFADCEAELTAKLWSERAERVTVGTAEESAMTAIRTTLARSDGVVLIGHGVPGVNGGWHRSGLLLGEGGDRVPLVLPGEEVAAAVSLRQVFVNACVLGQTRSFLGESLGMLAALFDNGSSIETAIGAVHPVYDFEAMLIALAFHHEVARTHTGESDQTMAGDSWREHFVRVQLAIDAGTWPGAFSGWLREHLADAIGRAIKSAPDRLDAWYGALQGSGDDDHPGVFDRMGLQPMNAGRFGDWLPDLQHLAEHLGSGVPASVRTAARSYVVLGD